jgi:hypothetical protein
MSALAATVGCGCGGGPGCGCCIGIRPVVPLPEANPPGLSAITYRVGTYAGFLETMLAALTTTTVTVPSAGGNGTDVLRPLANLTTRALSDPSIALLDAFAMVADVLSFYQERIANEGYLATAIHRRSLLELARLIGYRLRPGVAASVKLAFTVSTGFTGTIPAGTRAQSIPASGQTPQFFETSSDLVAQDGWNALPPLIARPQAITPAATGAHHVPLVTGADVIDQVYLSGISTNLKTGDALFFVFGPDASATAKPAQQYLRKITSVQALPNTTDPDLSSTLATLGLLVPAERTIGQELQLYAHKAAMLFPGSALATEVGDILKTVIDNLRAADSLDTPLTGMAYYRIPAAPILKPAVSRLAVKLQVAQARGFTRLTSWLSALIGMMQRASLGGSGTFYDRYPGLTLKRLPAALAAAPLARLGTIADKLATPPSVQPANALRLGSTVQRSFTPESDLAPRLLAKLNPPIADTLYPALSSVATQEALVEVYAPRVKATLFAANWAGPVTLYGRDPGFSVATPPNLTNAWGPLVASGGALATVPLDSTYDQIAQGSWVVFERPKLDANGNPTGERVATFHVVTDLASVGMATGTGAAVPVGGLTQSDGSGFAAKVTQLALNPPWLSELDAGDLITAFASTALLRQTVVYAQTDQLALADEPLDVDVAGPTLSLAQVEDGLEPGRWVIVSGTRTDIADIGGVPTSELAMIATVAQGTEAPGCVAFPLTTIPLSTEYYVSEADAYGDRLVVGKLAAGMEKQFALLGTPQILNQQFCEQVQLAPGLYANAYVPTAEEIAGNFPTFVGLLVDPTSGLPFDSGTIPAASLATGLFAWRIASPPAHTILSFAQPLAYSYDRDSVTVYGNVVDATHGQTTGEVLGNGNATQAFQHFTLSQSPMTYISAATPAGATDTLKATVNDLTWTEKPDLFSASPNSRAYIVRENEAHASAVTFGNGTNGLRLPTGTANVKAQYRYGLGSVGNVDAGQISQLATHPLGAQGVINPLPATGGADPDTLAQARANAPVAVMALDRLVSVVDYAEFSRAFAGIGKAVAARISDGTRQLVHVTIAGAEDIPIATTSDLYANLLQSLLLYGDPSLPVQLALRRAQLLVMQATIGLKPAYQWEDVAPLVQAAILACFAFDARDLGQTAFLSEAVQAAQAVEGVAWLTVTCFDGVPDSITAAGLAALGSTLKLRQYVLAELASIDANAAAGTPSRIRPAQVVYMTPDIPATLTLNPAT